MNQLDGFFFKWNWKKILLKVIVYGNSIFKLS